MDLFRRRGSPMSHQATAAVVEAAGHGGGFWAATFSAIAMAFSGVSFYLSALQQAELEVYVPPTIHYARDGGGDVELFALPLTIANEGARTGTVISMELVVEDPKEKKSKRYYSAFLGEHPRDSNALHKQFAPLSIPGRGVFTDTVRFYPAGNPLPKLVTDAGEFTFTLKLNTAAPAEPGWFDRLAGNRQPQPLVFSMTLPWLSEQQLGMRRATIAMHAKDWKPTTSGAAK